MSPRDASEAITLLVADLLLPDMDGREVVRQAVAADPALKVIS